MDAYDRLGRLLIAQHRTSEVIELWQKALRIQPDVPKLLNNLAWLFATYPDARFRNGSEAIRLASRAVELSQRSDGQAMDTLAAAYAEGGRFAEAVETAQAALTLAESAGQKEAAAQVRRRVQLYQSGQPYRE
jgi:tetratricopeptide (TPR) repeat protein